MKNTITPVFILTQFILGTQLHAQSIETEAKAKLGKAEVEITSIEQAHETTEEFSRERALACNSLEAKELMSRHAYPPYYEEKIIGNTKTCLTHDTYKVPAFEARVEATSDKTLFRDLELVIDCSSKTDDHKAQGELEIRTYSSLGYYKGYDTFKFSSYEKCKKVVEILSSQKQTRELLGNQANQIFITVDLDSKTVEKFSFKKPKVKESKIAQSSVNSADEKKLAGNPEPTQQSSDSSKTKSQTVR